MSEYGPSRIATTFWRAISARDYRLTFLGIMGDEAHRRRKSDHNQGLALDVGCKYPNSKAILRALEYFCSRQKVVNYVIFEDRITHPGQGTRYYGKGGHDTHVHISFHAKYRDKGVR